MGLKTHTPCLFFQRQANELTTPRNKASSIDCHLNMSNGEEQHGPEMPSEEGGTLLSDAAEESPSTKRKSPEKNNNDGVTATTTEEEPEPKKIKVTSLGIPAVKEDGKKYYQCKMSGCVKVRLIFFMMIAFQLIIYVQPSSNYYLLNLHRSPF